MDNSSDILIGEKVTIKEVTNDTEKSDALTVRKVVFVEEQKVPVELEIDEFDDSPTTVHFVGYYEDKPIAASRLRPYSEGTGKIERVAVLDSARSLGIGAKLMKKMEERALSLGFHKLKLNAQIQAEPFYSRLGYQSYGDHFMDAGIEHVAMQKELD